MMRRRTRKRKIFVTVLLLLAVFWLIGLLVFSLALPDSAPTEKIKTDALVVLTGGSLRLETGLRLLKEGVADKLFVSGVHRGVDVAELLRVSRLSPGRLDCCIVIGYEADDTVGNARETAEWMRANAYHSLQLVTANYHMPRSLLEFGRAMPEVKIYPYAVSPPHVKIEDWYLWPGSTMLILGEYNKLLFAPIRWLFDEILERVA